MSKPLSRRRFTQAAGAVAAAPIFVPKSAFGANDKITLAGIGIGWQGGTNMNQFLGKSDCRVVAVCDLDKKHLESAKNAVNKKYNSNDCKTYHDYHEVIARKDIDAVFVCTPDHWHALPVIAAANAGKDIFCEKPISHSMIEGIRMVQAVQKNHCIWQTGSWQRSTWNFHQAVELVINGHCGKITRVEVGLPSGHADFAKTGAPDPAKSGNPPAELDYETWIGPAQMMPYNIATSHKNWRWNYNTGGGQLMDWIGHHNDIAHWGLSDPEFGIGPDDQLGPLELSATAELPPHGDLWNTAGKFRIECKYPKDVQLVIASDNHGDIRRGTKWIGPDGWVFVDRGKFEASNPQWIKKGFDRGPKKAYKSDNHWQNFLDGIKTRKPCVTTAMISHRSVSPGHLGHVAAVLGQTLKWDAAKQVVTNSDAANKLLNLHGDQTPWMPYRKPYTL
ncbi:Gfo/Idh/MocA family oxidoreductase [Planctomycetales bacterium ZRK34]|nr:Gfo/Idh/MocA family oxidoreductase [Planctomycetales bacterium ZRK34]